MTEPAAILATFSDFALVRSRKVARLIFEVPIEQAKRALDTLGMPDPAGETWCGIARVQKSNSGTGLHGPVSESAAGDRAQVAAPAVPKPNSTRAVMMAKDEMFWRFLRSHSWTIEGERDADEALKGMCGVISKSELNRPPGANAFDQVRREFNSWRLSQ